MFRDATGFVQDAKFEPVVLKMAYCTFANIPSETINTIPLRLVTDVP